MRSILCWLLIACVSTPAHAWSECGHHIIAMMACQNMPAEQQQELIRILKAHPRFAEDFVPPENTQDKNLWLIGRAGCFPCVSKTEPILDLQTLRARCEAGEHFTICFSGAIR